VAEGGRHELVLVADDERDIVDLLAILLERAGYDVITAFDGRRALELARTHSPRLAILDGTMPGLAGFEVLEALREDERTDAVAVMILTATVDEEREIRRHGIEPDAFIRKPFESDDLLAEVARLVR
jgi:two-component system alkaline phosphatase synthesis response regulator PhoP/two-component system response regulator VicR